MSQPTSKHIVFDVIGTCLSYEALFSAIETRLGARLREQHGIDPRLLVVAWTEAAEREYTYLSMSGRYRPYEAVLGAVFRRILWMAGVEDPQGLAGDDDVRALVEAHATSLTGRPGVAECVAALREAGFTVWALTMGDADHVAKCLADNGIHFGGREAGESSSKTVVSCDSLGVGKPAPECYRRMLQRITKSSGDGDCETWFAAAHMWDVSSAKSNGFRGAYCTVLEKEPCVELFGEVDVIANGFPEMARMVIEASNQSQRP